MNETIKTQLNHRSIRQFKPLALTQEEVDLLVDVARHTATSNFRQSYSIISITDQKLKEEIAEIANQPYIPNAGHLFVFVVDQRRNTLIAEALKELTERKRNVILLSYFMEMSDADIAREMNLVRSTIHEHRTRSLEILRKIMEGIANEKDV